MKKILKNIALSIIIIYFILSIIFLVKQVIYEYTVVIPGIIQIAEEVSRKEISGEESYQLLASVYQAGYGDKIEIQVSVLVVSLILGILIGLVMTFEDKSKLRLFLKYIAGLLIIALYSALFEAFEYKDFSEFFYDILTVIDDIWKLYTLAFAVGYAIKIYINNKKTKELNKILKSKNNTENN